MKITLLQPHTHAGIEHQPGASLDVEKDQAEWLRDMGVAEIATAPKEAKKTTQGE